MTKYLKAIILLLVVIILSSCRVNSTPGLTRAEITQTEAAIPQPSPATPSPIPSTPTVTSIPPTPTSTLLHIPTTTATQTPEDIAPFRFISSLSGLPLDSDEEVQVRALVDGSVWIITSQAAMRWDDQAWQVVLDDQEGGLTAVDDSGQLWLLAQDASVISTLQNGKWIEYGPDSGWTSEGSFDVSWWTTAPWSVYSDASGILWVPMEHDVRAFDGNKWKVYDLEDMDFPIQEMEEISIVHSLAVAGDGREIWVGECYYSGPGPMGGGGVRWFKGQSWHGGDAPVGTTCISTISVDEMGDVWLGAYDSIWNIKHKSQSRMEYRLPESLLSGFNFAYPQQLIVDQSGDIWVIMQMCGGASCDVQTNLYRIKGGEWSLVIDAAYWGSSFKQLVLDGNGQGWLFWEGMFYRLSDQSLKQITSIMTRGVDVSPDGKIWVVAGTGDEASLQVFEP